MRTLKIIAVPAALAVLATAGLALAATSTTTAKKPMSAAQTANADKMKACGAKWRAFSASGDVARAEIGDNIAARPDRDDISIPELHRRPRRTIDTAVVINRLAVRSDDIDVGHRDRRFLERLQAGRGKRIADPDMELRDDTDV